MPSTAERPTILGARSVSAAQARGGNIWLRQSHRADSQGQLRGLRRVGGLFDLAIAAYNLARMRNLLEIAT
jgi:hypothetical protein